MPTAHEVEPGCSLPGRRRFLKQSAGAVATVATAGAASSTALADDDGDGEHMPTGTGPGSGPSGDLSSIYSLMTGDFWSPDELTEEEGEALHAELYREAVEMQGSRQNLFDSIDNDIEMLAGYIRDNVTHEMATVAAEGGDMDDLEEAVVDEVLETVANIETTLFNGWTTDLERLANRLLQVYNDDDDDGLADYAEDEVLYTTYTDDGDTYDTYPFAQESPVDLSNWAHFATDGDSGEEIEFQDSSAYEVDLTLANGENQRFPVFVVNDTDTEPTNTLLMVPFAEGDLTFYDVDADSTEIANSSYNQEINSNPYNALNGDRQEDFEESSNDDNYDQTIHHRTRVYQVDDTDSGYDIERADFLDARQYVEAHHELLELKDDELEYAVDTLVDTFGEPLLDGEIDPHDMASGNMVIEAAEELEDYGDAAAFYRQASYPEAEEAAIVELESGYELQGILFWTTPDDDGLELEESHDPEDLIGDIHMAAEVLEAPSDEDLEDEEGTEEGDVLPFQIHEEFEITTLDDGSGPLEFEDRELPDPQDPEDLQDMLEDAYEREQEAQEAAEDVDSGISAPSMPGFPDPEGLGQGASLLGLGLIGVVILAVIGFVTDLIPGLGN